MRVRAPSRRTSGLERARVRRDVDRVLTQRLQRDDREDGLVRRLQHHRRSHPGVVGECPVRRGDAPAVTGHQAGEAVLRSWCRQVVADAALVLQELRGDYRADRVAAHVLRARSAAAVAVEPGQRVGSAPSQGPSEHVEFGHTAIIAHSAVHQRCGRAVRRRFGQNRLMQRWDVVVVGAGPAGASAALSARQTDPGARVLLLDRARFPRDKVCGDGIAPQTFDLLDNLGAAGTHEGYDPVPMLRVGGPLGAEAGRRMARPARVIPRRVFDARLVDAALQAGAELAQRVVRRVHDRGHAVLVDDDIEADVVIGADGASSVVRRSSTTRRPPAGHTAVAIRGYASDSPTQHEQVIVMDAEDRWPAYAWSFPLADGSGRANVGYGVLVDPARAVQRGALIARLHHLLPWSQTAKDWRGHLLPLASWTPHHANGRVLLTGDAAHLVNPLTGEGIWYAVLSGMLAGQSAVQGGDHGARYRLALRRHLGRHMRDVRVLSRVGRTTRMVDAGVRAAAADQGVFDDLVEMGLTDGGLTPRLVGRTALALASPSRLAGLRDG